MLVFGMCVCAYAATRYVSHSGSNTAPYTTWETAANTIEAANLAMVPGDTMFIDTGSFQLTQTIVLPTKITLRGKGMDSTSILGDTTFYEMFKPGDSTHVEDIHFRGNKCFRGLTKYMGQSLFTWSIARCKFTNFMHAPIYASWTERVDVSHCWFEIWGDPGAIAVEDRGNSTITNCTFYSPGVWRPICSFSGNRTGHEVFDSNVVVGGGGVGISGVGANGFEMKYNLFYGKSFMTQPVYGGGAMEVAFNTFYIDDAWVGVFTNVVTVSCLTLNYAYIYNNIFAGFRPRIIFYFDIPDSADIRVVYNCFYSNYPMIRPHIGQISGSGTIDSVYGNVYADPMFVDQDNGDLHLQEHSPCIDAGAPWILDPDGTRSDIGVFGGPGGSVYAYQDLPPRSPDSLTAWRDNDHVILSWERSSEADFARYILFRTSEVGAPLDSEQVMSYLDRLARPIGGEDYKHLPDSDSDGKQFDPEQYIPIYNVNEFIGGYPSMMLRLVFYADWQPIDTLDSYYTLVAVDSSGLASAPSVVQISPPQAVGHPTPAQNTGDHEGRPYDIADSASLEPNYPNPFNAVTAIVYNLPNIGAQPAPVRLVVYNILGQEIKSLTDEKQQPGRHIAYWDGTDQRGQPVASGVYFYRLEVSGIEFVKSGKMILMK